MKNTFVGFVDGPGYDIYRLCEVPYTCIGKLFDTSQTAGRRGTFL